MKVEASMANLDNSVQSKEIAAAAVHGVFCVIEGAEEALEEVYVFVHEGAEEG